MQENPTDGTTASQEQETKPTFKERVALYLPSKYFLVTPLIIITDVIIFILMSVNGVHIMEPEATDLIKWGASFSPLTLGGEWWRLFTACFIHIGIIHLLLNMYALLYVGILLEPLIGKVRFLVAYILAGVAGSVVSLFFHKFSASAGASGAIFGMYGVFIALLTTNLIDKASRQGLLSSIGIFVGYNLLFGIKGNIDNAAHIGGLVAGIIIGYSFYFSLEKPDSVRFKVYSTLAVLIVFSGGLFALYQSLPKDMVTYSNNIESFTRLEESALEILRKDGIPPVAELKRGEQNWDSCIILMAELEELDLPGDKKQITAQLKEYSQLRKEWHKVYAKAVEENTSSYDAELDRYNASIDSVLKVLNGPSKEE